MFRILKNIKYKLATLFLIFKMNGSASAQTPSANFESEINYYRQADIAGDLFPHPILFIGSSSIKNWKDLDSSFEGYNCLNRGFGGSTISDVIYYADDVIFNHDPKQIVLYCGENDFAKDSASAATVFLRFYDLYSLIRNKFPDVPIVYISIKPSPAKERMLYQINDYNKLIKDFVSNQTNIVYADVYSKMIGSNGQPDRSLFYEDMLHMNEKGYAVWNEALRPFLIN